ncbi:MAG: alpha/beta hydrolase [Devosia sp.]|uniref:alpha/beta hydrolase n=1 Tax=Devosia sp. TaxID=1871048 RepID=UPI0024CC8006|nr:alpha/beta hydrolase [Devosia sp.]UYO00278.1 MAG: alpha/beta hydrolase [Devosia sp.]
MNLLRSAMAAAILSLTVAGAHAEVETLIPEGNSGFATLLSGVSYTKVANGFARNNLEMDLLLPGSQEPTAAIVFVMGNGWQSIDRRVLIPQLSELARAGYAVATIDYRIIGEATFPEPEKDVKAAIRFLRENASRFNIDPDRIGLFGNSAGGHLSLVAGLSHGVATFANDEWADQDDSVKAIVAFYAPSFLGDMSDSPTGRTSAHMGMDLSDPANLEAGKAGDPITYADETDPPVLLIHGTEDVVVPIEQSDRLHDELAAAGVDVTLLRVEGIGHSFGKMSSTPEVMARVRGFFDAHL